MYLIKHAKVYAPEYLGARTMSNLLAKAKGLEEEGITTYVYTGSYQVPVRTLTGSIMDDVILLDKVF